MHACMHARKHFLTMHARAHTHLHTHTHTEPVDTHASVQEAQVSEEAHVSDMDQEPGRYVDMVYTRAHTHTCTHTHIHALARHSLKTPTPQKTPASEFISICRCT